MLVTMSLTASPLAVLAAEMASTPSVVRATSAILGLAEALLSQQFHGCFHVPAGLLQGVLAIHHANAGFFAQVLDQRSGDIRHGQLLQKL
jgi:hypothetical protein